MKPLLFILTLFLLAISSIPTIAQRTIKTEKYKPLGPQLLLVKGSKEINLTKLCSYGYDLGFYNTLTLPNGDIINEHFRAVPLGVNNDSIKIKASSYSYAGFLYSGQNWTGRNFKNSDSIVVLQISSLDQVKAPKVGVEVICGALLSFAAVSAVIVSPLVSINYKQRDFNWNRFAIMEAFSVGIFAASVAIQIKYSEKKYKLKGSKNAWTLKQQ
jgi:hypothetical protein